MPLLCGNGFGCLQPRQRRKLTPTMLDPAEYRRRAQACREKAETATIAKADLLEAAAVWEQLAQHAEFMISIGRSPNQQREA